MGTVARRRAVGFPVGAGVVILALLTVFAIELSSTQARSRSAVTDRVHEGSVLAGALIDSLVQSVAQQIPQDRLRYGGRVVSDRTMDANVQQNVYLALLDRSVPARARRQVWARPSPATCFSPWLSGKGRASGTKSPVTFE